MSFEGLGSVGEEPLSPFLRYLRTHRHLGAGDRQPREGQRLDGEVRLGSLEAPEDVVTVPVRVIPVDGTGQTRWALVGRTGRRAGRGVGCHVSPSPSWFRSVGTKR